jgi:hypothetical protein
VARRFVLALVVIVMLLASGVAIASIPGPDGVIHGCYKNSNGDLIVIDHAANCPGGYTSLNWNQVGPPGPSGIAGHEVVTAQDLVPAFSSFNESVDAFCPTGKVATGGGFTALNYQYLTVVRNHPSGPTGWYLEVSPNGQQPVPQEFVAYVVCANAA